MSSPRGICRKPRTKHERKVAKSQLHGRPTGGGNYNKAHHRGRRNRNSCRTWR